jgi:hypothetical protein
MAATQTALISQKYGTALSALPNPGKLDILQIVDEGQGVLVNVDYTGTVHFPAVSPTLGSLQAPYQSHLATTNTLAQIFAEAFTNPAWLDILQVINQGGGIVYWLDYLGVAHGS